MEPIASTMGHGLKDSECPKNAAFQIKRLRLGSVYVCILERGFLGRRVPNRKPQKRLRFRDLRGKTLAFKKNIAIFSSGLEASLGARVSVQVLGVQKVLKATFCVCIVGRRTEQAKANLDPRLCPRVAPQVGPWVDPRARPTSDRPRERPRQDPLVGWFPCSRPFKDSHESSHETSHEGVHGNAH